MDGPRNSDGWLLMVHEALCLAIWRETYRHDTLMEWHEIKTGSLHHQRVVAAARAAYKATQCDVREDALK